MKLNFWTKKAKNNPFCSHYLKSKSMMCLLGVENNKNIEDEIFDSDFSCMIDDLGHYEDLMKKHKIRTREGLEKALEKQIPKKPDLEGDGYDENGDLIYDTGYCPNCRHMFEVDYDATDYCPACGQALDWSDTE